MKSKASHIIKEVVPGSIAEELELSKGDCLLSVNGEEIEDVFDYHYLTNDEEVTLLIQKPDGEEWELQIEKEYDEDIGIVFENGLMDDYKSCSNHCVFCFIDQMPPGMRETLYFKDDDSRLSFLQGNYVTLTNMKEKDIERIIRYHLAPINISVHTTNPELRCRMLGNRFAGEALSKIKTLYDAGIEMNGQIVLCKGLNDGEELNRSIRDLMEYHPFMRSLSVVPVGLTRYREGLYPLEEFRKEDARKVLETIHAWQERCYGKHGTHFVQAADEWYLLAEKALPPSERYDDFIQLENGVGMLRLLMDEFREALLKADKKTLTEKAVERRITLITGTLAAPFLRVLAGEFMERFPFVNAEVIAIRNEFFGELITVSGLLTGKDILSQLRGRDLGECLLLPVNLLRSGENVLLDDVTTEELSKALQIPVVIVKSSGQSLFDALIGG